MLLTEVSSWEVQLILPLPTEQAAILPRCVPKRSCPPLEVSAETRSPTGRRQRSSPLLESDEVLGALAGFLSSHCDRMRIGSFKSLRVLGEGHLILARKLSTGSTIFYSGSQQDGIAQVERCLQNSFDDQVEVGAKR